MADILADLLKAIYDDIEIQRASTLSFLDAHYICSPVGFNLDKSTPIPFLLLYPLNTTCIPKEIGIYKQAEKFYTIMFSIFIEFPDENEGIIGDSTAGTLGTVNASDAIESRYDRNRLNLAQSAILQNISFNQSGPTKFNELDQVHLRFEYLHVDRRTS